MTNNVSNFKKPLIYYNGKAKVTIEGDNGENGGTRIVEFPEDKEIHEIIDYPLNIDIRLSNKCPLGYNSKTGKSICYFCHESARTDGHVGDINYLIDLLDKQIPYNMHIELAVGVNEVNDDIIKFFKWASNRGFIINATINQSSVATNKKSSRIIIDLINNNYISGLGISFRNIDTIKRIPKELINYPSTVFHVINGLDNFDDVKKLSLYKVKKILVLGEKNFGFNVDYYNNEKNISDRLIWYLRISELFNIFDVVSFDNLGLEQLNIKRFVNDKDWQENYQGEYSMYINLVDKYFSTSSRSNFFISSDKTNIKDFFKKYVLKK